MASFSRRTILSSLTSVLVCYSLVILVSPTTYNVGLVFTTGRCGMATACGQTHSNEDIQRGQLDPYTFTGVANERVRVAVDEIGATFANLSVSLYSPLGTLVGQASGKPAVIDNVVLPAPGSYTIVVSSVVFPTTYNVGLVFTTGRCGTATACGQTHSNKDIQRGQLDPYAFAGNSGGQIRVVVEEASPSFANLSVSLYAPSGAMVGQASGKPAVIDSSLPLTGTYTIVVSSAVAPTTYNIGLSCSLVPILISEETSTRAIALDSVVWLRDPFQPTSPVPWGSDTRTRVMIFAMNFDRMPGENLSVVTADAEDVSHRIYPMTVEFVGKIPEFDWLSYLVVRLNDDMGNIGDVLVRITARGISSNRVRIGIGHTGGGPPDDPGAVPTPADGPNSRFRNPRGLSKERRSRSLPQQKLRVHSVDGLKLASATQGKRSLCVLGARQETKLGAQRLASPPNHLQQSCQAFLA